MATNKLIKPTNVTVSIPAFTDQPDQRANSNCIDKSIDGINALSDQIDTLLKNSRGTRIDISGYSLSSRYTTTTDGYLYVVNSSGASGKGYIYDSSNNNFGAIGGNVGEYMAFIRKGMQLGAYQSPSQIYFVPFA